MHTYLVKITSYALGAILLCFGCKSKIYTHRHQFIQKEAPIIDVQKYRSVQERPNQNPDVAIAMAISGGGSRAYNFAMGVLLELDNIYIGQQRSILNEIDYFSTVSGGGFAAGSYVSALYEHQTYHPGETFHLKPYYDNRIKKALSKNYTSPIVGSWVNPVTWFSFLDDGDALEKSIDKSVLGLKERRKKYGWKSTRSIQLGDMFIDKNDTTRTATLPFVVANGTIFRSMDIFPFAPNILDTFQISGYTHYMRKHNFPEPVDPYTLPLSVGIKASGSFPVAISNTTLISTYHSEFRFLHIIDGGIADNIGYHTALNMLIRDTVAQRKVLLVVDADGEGIVPTFSRRQRGAMALKVYSRLPSSGLDSRHNLFRSELISRCREHGIIPVFLSFGSLIEQNPDSPDPIIFKENAQQKMIAQLKLAPQAVSGKDLQILYELVTNVQTKYSITPLEQQLLNLTGKKVVIMKNKEIMAALGVK
ncbi:MAG: patatin-like phospholipase family protein [Bacteroidetes bacterium]|nr:patatin-like phospholipase family protein [Bacteroidota bacterium]